MAVRSAPSPGCLLADRLVSGARYVLITAVLVVAVGIAGHYLAWPLLTSTVGPTAYVFAAHPRSESARFQNALVGHAVALACGLGALTVFGLARHPSLIETGSPSLSQVAAAVTAVGLSVFLLELLGSHHAPSAATALLVTTGLAKPGSPLIGLVLGLAIVIALGPLIGRIPLVGRARLAEDPPGRRGHHDETRSAREHGPP